MAKPTMLRKNREFLRVYKRGACFPSHLLICYVLKTKRSDTRLGITASKKIGNAVERNRARRLLMESYRQLAPKITKNCDIVLVARGKTTRTKMQDVLSDMKRCFIKSGILED